MNIVLTELDAELGDRIRSIVESPFQTFTESFQIYIEQFVNITVYNLQVLSMSEELRRALYTNSAVSLDNEVIVPDLVGTTEILSDEHRDQLCRHLPARAEGYLWTLVFSTSQHGFSLNSMYRKMAKIESPILLVIEDTEGNVSFI